MEGIAWLNLVEDVWHTEVTGISDVAGRFQVEGILGDYRIVARVGSLEQEVFATLEPGGATVMIRLDVP